MATQKTWTAGNIKMNRMRLHLDENSVLHCIQDYSFLDVNGEALTVFPSRTIQTSVNWADVPVDAQNGLVAINDYMYNLALNKEGMND